MFPEFTLYYIVLAQKRAPRSLEENRIQSLEINTHTYGRLSMKNEVRIWGKDSKWENWTATCKNNEIRAFIHAIHENKLRMDSRPKYKTGNHKTPRRKHRQHTL